MVKSGKIGLDEMGNGVLLVDTSVDLLNRPIKSKTKS